MNKKNIVILTASHPLKSAGIAAYDLMRNLKKSGYNVVIITNYSVDKKHPGIISLKKRIYSPLSVRIKNKLKSLLSKLFIKKNLIKFNKDYHMNGLLHKSKNNVVNKILENLPYKVDSFIYLFPQFFLNTCDLYYLNLITKAPIFWYMMDMAPITGGCHYAWECTNYKKKCGQCPGIYSNDEYDLTNKLWNEKNIYIQKTNIIPIAASEWQFSQLKQSSLFRSKEKYKILLSINEDLFIPTNKKNARIELGLPIDKKIIFFGSVTVNDNRKGLVYLIEALKILKVNLKLKDLDDVLLVIAGNNSQQLDKELPFDYRFLGYLDFKALSKTFQAIDLFVSPSIEDSGPMMINQSIMSGRPVVSFEMGVALDLIINYKTGYRAENKNSRDLAKGIEFIITLTKEELEVINENCRNLALEKTSSKATTIGWNNILNQNN